MPTIPNKIYKSTTHGYPVYQILPAYNVSSELTEVPKEQALTEIQQVMQEWGSKKVAAGQPNAGVLQYPDLVKGYQDILGQIQNMSQDSGYIDKVTTPWGETLTNVSPETMAKINKEGFGMSPQQFKDQNAKMAAQPQQPTGYQGNNVPPAQGGATPQQPTGNLADTIAQNVLNRMNQGTGTTGTQGGQTQQTYQVPAGSNLTRSAQAMGITLQQLLDANPEYKANPNMVQAGAMLKYPGGSTTGGQNAPQGQLGGNTGGSMEVPQNIMDQWNSIQQQAQQLLGTGTGVGAGTETPAPTADDILKGYGLGAGQSLSIDEIVAKISDAFGLKDIKTEMTNLSTDLSNEVMEINENPWLSEQARQEKINRTNEKFESRKNAIYERLKAEQPMVAAALDLYQQQETSRQQILLQAMKDASEQANKTTTDLTEYQFAKGQGYTGSFQQWQKEQANLKATASGATGLNTAQMNSTINQIAGAFDGEPVVKDYNAALSQYQLMNSIGTKTSSPGDDIAFVYAFAKIMDPNSVVREGEYATVQKYAQDLLSKTQLDAVRTVSNQNFLTSDAKQKLLNASLAKMKVIETQYSSLANQYKQRIQNVQSGGFNTIPDYMAFGSVNVTPENQSVLDSVFSNAGGTTQNAPTTPQGTSWTDAAQGVADWLRGFVGLK
jgi:hypothetical protein